MTGQLSRPVLKAGRKEQSFWPSGHITTLQKNAKRTKNMARGTKGRSANGRIGLRVPPDVIAKKSAQYLRKGKPIHRAERLQNSDYSIVMHYQQEYRGIVQYYLLAQNVSHLYRLHWAMKGSLLKTLASKHQTSPTKMARRYQTTLQAPNGTDLKCLRVVVERKGKKPLVAQFGGLQLIPQPKATILDQLPKPMNTGTEILQRMLANTCELCKSTKDIEVHVRRFGGRDRAHQTV